MNIQLNRTTLNFKAVHIQCLNEEKNKIPGAFASGFILAEDNKLYLYTCWHVVTGFNMHNIEIGRTLPNRKYIEVNLQNCETRQPGIQAIGGIQTTILPLYDNEGKQLWIQNQQDIPNFELNNIGLKVPFWNDIVKLPLPETVVLSEVQIIKREDAFEYIPNLGDKVYLLGYPYGYSTLGIESPTPVVLTRFIAANRIKDRREELLLDGPGAPGMSGGPIFIEAGNRLYLCGLYTGLIYPDFAVESNEKTTALGTMVQLSLWWSVKKE